MATLLASPFDNDPDRLLDELAKIDAPDLAYRFEATLAQADYLPRLAEISAMYADNIDLDRYQDQAITWERRQIPGFCTLLLVGLYWALGISLRHSIIPRWSAWSAGAVALAALIVVLIFGVLHLTACDSLATLLRRYE